MHSKKYKLHRQTSSKVYLQCNAQKTKSPTNIISISSKFQCLSPPLQTTGSPKFKKKKNQRSTNQNNEPLIRENKQQNIIRKMDIFMKMKNIRIINEIYNKIKSLPTM